MADITKIKVIEDGVETIKEIGVSTPIKTELDKRANKDETIKNITIDNNSTSNIMYELLTKLKNNEIKSNEYYLINGYILGFIGNTYSTNYYVYLYELSSNVNYKLNGYINVANDFTLEDITYTTETNGLYTHYLKFSILGDDNIERRYQISIDTFKPTISVEEFRDYIRNRLIYTDTPNYQLTCIKFMTINNQAPLYLAFTSAYYGTPTCQIDEIKGDGTLTSIIESTNISVVVGRITEFEVFATFRS